MMIYFKRRKSSFADPLKSLDSSIPESNRKEPNTSVLVRTKTYPTELAFNATKDDDDLLEKKSVIFCWLTEVSLIVHSGRQPKRIRHIISFGADKNRGNWGRIQRDERWWWSTWKEECHLLLTHWSYFNGPFGKATKRTKHIISFDVDNNLGNWARIQRDKSW